MDCESQKKKVGFDSVFVLILTALLSAGGIALTVMRKLTVVYMTVGRIVMEETFFSLLLIGLFFAVFSILKRASFDRLAKIGRIILAVILVATVTCALIFGVVRSGYVRLPALVWYVYPAALYGLFLYATAYAGSQHQRNAALYSLLVYLPIVCAVVGLIVTRALAVALGMVLTSLLFALKLMIDRRKSKACFGVFLGAVLVGGGFAAFGLLFIPAVHSRWAASLTGVPYPLWLSGIKMTLPELIQSAKVVGTSDLMLGVTPAYKYLFHLKSDSCSPLVLLLKYGWVGLAVVLLVTLLLVVFLFRISARTKDKLGKCVSSVTACYFLARIAVALFSDFFLFCSHAYLPFFADWITVMVDVSLVLASVALFRRSAREEAQEAEVAAE